MTIPLTALVVGTPAEALSGELATRVLRRAHQDHMVAIALRVVDEQCFVLLTAAPSRN